MLAIIARYQFANAGDAGKFCDKAQAIVDGSRAEQGCNLYAFARDIADDTVVWISEEWASQDDLTAHLKADHITAFLESVAGLEIVGEDSRQYEVSSVGPVVMPGA